MTHDNNDSLADDSTYPVLEMPEFESTIPEHLLHDVSKENRFVMENINIQTQYIKWLCQAAIETNQQVRTTNGRLKKVESWKDKLSNWWVASAAIFAVGGTATLLIAKLAKTLSDHHSVSIF